MSLYRKPTAANALAASRKKWIERQYVEEARRASSLVPPGELAPQEPPDFLLLDGGITVGIEVTLLCREEQRAESVRLSRVADKARSMYSRFTDSVPLDVTAVFAPDTERIGLHQLTTGLANFIHDNWRGQGCSFDWNEFELPAGYCYLTIQPAREAIRPWWGVKCFRITVASNELLASRISEKNFKLPDYLKKAGEVWLLIVNDQFLGAGGVHVQSDQVARWKFAFDFDKVLLFTRELGGGGEVIELQRA